MASGPERAGIPVTFSEPIVRSQTPRFPAMAALLLLAACTQTGESANAPADAPRWPVVGAFEHFNERIEGTVWLDEARNELRFELEGVETRFKCVGPGEIESSILGENQCRQIEGDFALHCGVQRELFGSFEFNSCDFGFAAGIDTLTGSTVAMHFGLSPERLQARDELLVSRAANQPVLEEPENYLRAAQLDPDLYSLGTGFAITTDGLILTAAHVVDDQYGIEVHSGGRVAEAEIVAIDQTSDLALLRTDLEFDPLPLLEPSAAPGEAFPGLAIGYRILPDMPPKQMVETAYTHRLTRGPLFGFEGDIIPGYSGGPFFISPTFKVVGVLHAIAVTYELAAWDDYAIEKLAYAVDYETMMDFLERSLDAATLKDIADRSVGRGATYPIAGTDSIVLIVVY
jgi:S1-C subfamily serine protease